MAADISASAADMSASAEPSLASQWSWRPSLPTSESLFKEWPETPAGGCHLCAPLTAKTVKEMVEQMHQAKAAGATMVEVRLDHMYGWLLAPPRSGEPKLKEDLRALLDDRPLPVILTYRPDWEGGKYEGDELDRLRVLWDAMDLDVDYVDIELGGIKKDIEKEAYKYVYDSYFGDLKIPKVRRADMTHKYDVEFQPAAALKAGAPPNSRTKIIISSHNYKHTPDVSELREIARKMVELGADVVKIATTATDVADNLKLFQIVKEAQVPTIALAMGPKGLLSRVLAPKFGAFLTFGTLAAGLESAPGQPTITDLLQTFHLDQQSRNTKIFGVVGNPVAHSKGPLVHNAALQFAGVDAVYVPYLVDNLRTFLADFATDDFAGFSVTIPHKQAALELADTVDPLAQTIGAVNTLVRRRDGTLSAYNTDCSAAIKAIEEGLKSRSDVSNKDDPLQGLRVLVVGAGGAGRALAFGAKAMGAEVLIANRTDAKAEELAAAAGARFVPWASLQSGSVRVDVLANTTSVGMQPNVTETPVPKAALGGCKAVFDAVYTPMETQLLKDAWEVGATPVSGVEMFVGQAADQFELFTGQPAPRQLMRDLVLESVSQPAPVGPPAPKPVPKPKWLTQLEKEGVIDLSPPPEPSDSDRLVQMVVSEKQPTSAGDTWSDQNEFVVKEVPYWYKKKVMEETEKLILEYGPDEDQELPPKPEVMEAAARIGIDPEIAKKIRTLPKLRQLVREGLSRTETYL